MKKTLLFIAYLFAYNGLAQLQNKALVVPEFSNKIIKTYFPISATSIAANAEYTINLTTLPNGFASAGNPNSVAMYGNDLFVSITGNNQGIYKFPNYGNNPTSSLVNVQQITNVSTDYVGITLDSNGNLYTSEGSYLDTHIVKYTASSNYSTRIDLGNGGLVSYFSNIAFDSTGNLWATDYKNNRIIAINLVDLNTSNASFHVCNTNTTTWNTSGGTNANLTSDLNIKTIHLAFSQPEGLAFDSNGYLWVANNNDGTSGILTNQAPTLVRISPTMLNTILTNTSYEANPNLTNSINGYRVWNIPSPTIARAQLGGMQIDTILNRIFVNEEVSHSGMWFDISTLSNITDNFVNYQLSITSTNPGNGGIFLANSNQILKNQSHSISHTAWVAPNPCKGIFSVESNSTIKSVKAFDTLGKEITILTENIGNFYIQNKGFYLLLITLENGETFTQKIIIE